MGVWDVHDNSCRDYYSHAKINTINAHVTTDWYTSLLLVCSSSSVCLCYLHYRQVEPLALEVAGR